ncbi:hypothetical protein ABPG74_007763 [Tetrahymena malaccensis]
MDKLQITKKQNLDIKTLLDLFLHNGYSQQDIKGKDIILLIGQKRSGKSSTAKYLLGYKIQKNNNQIQKENLDSTEELKTGHLKYSQTLSLYESEFNDIFLCDSHGFFDNCDLEIEIFNECQLIKVIQNCNSIRLVMVVSYIELSSQRGVIINEVYEIISRIFNILEKEQFEKINFLFTKVPNQDENLVIQEINYFIQGSYHQDMKKLDFLNVLLDKVQQKRSLLTVDPFNINYQSIMKKILDQEPIINPSQVFSLSFQYKSLKNLTDFIYETADSVIKMLKNGQYMSTMETMRDIKRLKDYIRNQYLLTIYQDLENEIIKNFNKQNKKAFDAFREAAQQCNTITCQNIKEIRDLINQLNVIDEQKANLFEDGQFQTSENEFKALIEDVCSEIGETIKKEFPKEIEKVKTCILNLKNISEITSLGSIVYKESQKQIASVLSNEKQNLEDLSNQIYIKQKNVDINSIKENVSQVVQKLNFIKQIHKYFNGFIIDSEEDSFYAAFINNQQNNNKKTLSNLKQNIDKIYEAVYDEKFSDDENQINLDLMLPSFEINLLKILSSNKSYSENIPGCEDNYNQVLQYIKLFNQNILSLIIEIIEDPFYFKSLEFILKLEDKLRKQLDDDFILDQIADNNKQIKEVIVKKIHYEAKEAEIILQIYQQEIEESSSDDDDENYKKFCPNYSRKENISQKKDFLKLQKSIDFLIKLEWTDKYFQSRLAQNILKKLVQKLTNNINDCIEKIKKILNTRSQNQLMFYIQKLTSMNIFQNINTDFKQKYEECINYIINAIKEFINDLNRDNNLNSYQLIIINQNIWYLKKFNKLDIRCEIKQSSKSSLQTITDFMQNYTKRNFEKIDQLLQGQIDKNMSECSEFIKQSKQIAQYYKKIESIIKGYTFTELSDKIKNVFQQIVNDYQQKYDQMEDLQEIQESFNIIEMFVKRVEEIDLIKQEFKKLPTPREIINLKFEYIDTLIRNEEFQDLDKEIQLFLKLDNKKYKQKLEKQLIKFSNVVSNETLQINSILSQLKDGNIVLIVSVQNNLQKISQIHGILKKNFMDTLFQNLQKDLNIFLSDLVKTLNEYQKQVLITNINQLNFTIMEHHYELIKKFINSIAIFQQIFQQDKWEDFIQQSIENIKNQIEKNILDLHKAKELKPLIILLSKLKESQQQNSVFQVSFEKEIINTNEEIKSTFEKEVQNIIKKIQSQNLTYYKDLKALKRLTDQIKFFDLQQHKEYFVKLFEFGEKINQESKYIYLDIQKYIVQSDYEQAKLQFLLQIKEVEEEEEEDLNKMIESAENQIEQALFIINNQFHSIDAKIFQSYLYSFYKKLQIIEQFGSQQQQECFYEIILKFLKLINSKSFQIIEGELQNLYEDQKLLMEYQVRNPHQKINWKRYDDFLQILNLNKELFDISVELKNIKKIGLKILSYDQLLQKINDKFCFDFEDSMKKNNCRITIRILIQIEEFFFSDNTNLIDTHKLREQIQLKFDELNKEKNQKGQLDDSKLSILNHLIGFTTQYPINI